MGPLRLGLVGVGLMGQGQIESNQNNALGRIVAIAARNPERLELIRGRYDIAKAYTDYREMFAKEDLDGVIVCTPDDFHREPVEDAAAAGIHVLVEKPIATTLADGEAMVSACEKAGVKLMVGFVLRFTTPYLVLRQRLQAGELGQPTMVFASRAVSKVETRRVGAHRTALQALAVHDIDTVLWNFGTDIESVYCARGDHQFKEEFDIADYYWTTLRYGNGFTAVVLSHWAMPEAYPSFVTCEMLVTGTSGSAHLKLAGEDLNVVTDKQYQCPDVVFAFSVAGGSHAFRSELEHFCQSIRSGREPLVTGRDGLNALRITVAAEESARLGQAVPVSLERVS